MPDQKRSSNSRCAFLARASAKLRWKITTQEATEAASSSSMTTWTTRLAFMIRWGMDMESFT